MDERSSQQFWSMRCIILISGISSDWRGERRASYLTLISSVTIWWQIYKYIFVVSYHFLIFQCLDLLVSYFIIIIFIVFAALLFFCVLRYRCQGSVTCWHVLWCHRANCVPCHMRLLHCVTRPGNINRSLGLSMSLHCTPFASQSDNGSSDSKEKERKEKEKKKESWKND